MKTAPLCLLILFLLVNTLGTGCRNRDRHTTVRPESVPPEEPVSTAADTEAAGGDGTGDPRPFPPEKTAPLTDEERRKIEEGVYRMSVSSQETLDKCPACILERDAKRLLEEISIALAQWNSAWNRERRGALNETNTSLYRAETAVRLACLAFETEKRDALIEALSFPNMPVVQNAVRVADDLMRTLHRCAHPNGFAIFYDELDKGDPKNSRLLATGIVRYQLTDYFSAGAVLGRIETPTAKTHPVRIALYTRVFRAAVAQISGDFERVPPAFWNLQGELQATGDIPLQLRFLLLRINRLAGSEQLELAATQMKDLLHFTASEPFGPVVLDRRFHRAIYRDAVRIFHAAGDPTGAEETLEKMVADAKGLFGFEAAEQATLLLDFANLLTACDQAQRYAKRALALPLSGEEKETIRRRANQLTERCSPAAP